MITAALKTGFKVVDGVGPRTTHTTRRLDNNDEHAKAQTLAFQQAIESLHVPYVFTNPFRTYHSECKDLSNNPLKIVDVSTDQEVTTVISTRTNAQENIQKHAAAFQYDLNWSAPNQDAEIFENIRVLDAEFKKNLEALQTPYEFENPFETYDSDCEDFSMTPLSSKPVLSNKPSYRMLEIFNENTGTTTYVRNVGRFQASQPALDHISKSMVAAAQSALFSNNSQDVWQAALVENWSRVDAHIDFLSKNLPIASYGIGEDNQHSKPVHFFHGLENLLKRTRFAGKEMDYQSLSDYTRLLAFTGFILSKKSVLKEIIQSYGSIDSSFCFVLPSSLNITFDIVQKQDQQGKKINGQFIVKIYIQSQDHFDRAWVLHSNKETFTKSAFSGSSHIELTIEYDFSKPLHDEQGQKKPLFPFEARLGTLWALPFDQEVFIHPEKYANSSDNAAHNAMIEQLIANRKAFNAESPEKHAARKNDILALTRDVMKVTSLNLSYEINT